MAPTRVAVVEETLAEPKDIEVYKATYENVILIGSGTYGSVYYIRQVKLMFHINSYFQHKIKMELLKAFKEKTRIEIKQKHIFDETVTSDKLSYILYLCVWSFWLLTTVVL